MEYAIVNGYDNIMREASLPVGNHFQLVFYFQGKRCTGTARNGCDYKISVNQTDIPRHCRIILAGNPYRFDENARIRKGV
jgi:hypothetical protein